MDGIKLHFKTISDSLNTIYMNDCKVEFLESEIEIHGTNEAQNTTFSILIDVSEKKLYLTMTEFKTGTKITSYEYAIKTWSIGGI